MTQSVIGALRVTLGLDSAQFLRGTRQAESSMQRLGRRMRNVGAAMSAVGTGLALAVRGQLNAAEAIGRQAQVANASVEEFQRAAMAARSVGIETDKLADIYKDMADRVGDFLATGGGPMADFFENIAPQVGLTAEHFRDLSGPAALQAYVSALEAANLNQNEMTFYMEAIASDATALIPLLRNNGDELNRLADAAQNAGVIMSSETIEAARDFNANLRQLGDVTRGFVAILTANLAPVLSRVSEIAVDLAQKFQGLSPEVQKFASILAVAFVAGGPILVGLGLVAMSISALSAPFALAVAGATALAAAAAVIYTEWDNITAAVTGWLQGLTDTLKSVGVTMRDTINVWTAQARDWGRDTIQGLIDGFLEMVVSVGPAIAQVWKAIQAEIATWPGKMIDLGKNLVKGLINGIRGDRAAVVSETEALANAVVDAAFEATETNSPSRVFQRLGGFLTEGLALGISAGAPQAVSAMEGVANQIGGTIEATESKLDRFASGFASFIGPVVRHTQTLRSAFANMATSIGNSLINTGLRGIGGMLGNALGLGRLFGGLPSFEGGGFTGNGARVGGIDGRGGILSVLHPKEAVVDLTRGGMGGGTVRVIVQAEEGAMFRPTVRAEAEGVAVQVVQSGLQQYDRNMPDRVAAIQNDPLARG